jgi:hypothetical protein
VNVGQLFIEIEKEKVMNSNTTALYHIVICQDWVEVTPGWGGGCSKSLHLSGSDRCCFIRNYQDSVQHHRPPFEYSRPYGDPYLVLVNNELWEEIVNYSKFGGRRGEWIGDTLVKGKIECPTTEELLVLIPSLIKYFRLSFQGEDFDSREISFETDRDEKS